MKKKTVSSIIAVAMLLAVSLYFVGGTYARYTSSFTGEASLPVAKWAVKLSDQESDAVTTMNLEFTVDDNENVVENKIAPATTATATAKIDLEGTEVAVDVLIAGQSGDLETALQTAARDLGMNPEDIKFTIEVSGEGTITGDKIVTTTAGKEYKIALPSTTDGFTAGNSEITITITAEWQDNGNDSEDTAAGKKATALTVPIKLTVQQHIDSGD